MFWSKQAFYTSVLIFGVLVLLPYVDFVLGWLFLAALTVLTWHYYNQPIDETGTIENRHCDFRPMFMALGILLFCIGYFNWGSGNRAPNAIAFGLGIAFLPLLAVEACRISEAKQRGYACNTMFVFFFWPLFASIISGGAYLIGSSAIALYALVIGQAIQLFLAFHFDYAKYTKTHASPFRFGN